MQLSPSTIQAIADDLAKSHKMTAGPNAAPIDWMSIITTLLPVILQLLTLFGAGVKPVPVPTPAPKP